MILLMFSFAILTTASTAQSDFAKNVEQYADMIVDVQKFYRIPSICVIFYDEENADLGSMVELQRRISKRQVFSQLLHEANFRRAYPRWLSTGPQQLFVALLRNGRDLERFGFFGKGPRVHQHVWLLLFHDSAGWEVCRAPGPENRYGLHFGVKILAKCPGEKALREWYSSGGPGSRIQPLDFLEWSPENGLVLIKDIQELYERRRNLTGVRVKAAYVDDAQYTRQGTEVDENFRYGLFPHILEELAQLLSLEVSYDHVSFSYGTWDKRQKKWSGILGRLWNDTLDVAAAELVLTQQRVGDFDFTYPILMSRARLFFRMPNSTQIPWNAYLKTFNMEVWMMMGYLIVISLLVLVYIKIKLKEGSLSKYFFFDSYMHIWGIFCNQGLSDHLNSPSLKLAYLSIFLSAFLLISVYSGSLTSYVTVSTPTLPFTSIPEFADEKTYKLIVMRNSAEHEELLNSEHQVQVKMRHKLKPNNELPTDYIHGFTQVCNEHLAFFVNEAMKNKVKRKIPCEITSIYAGRMRYLSIALKKHDPLTYFLSYYIKRFEETGLLQRIKKNYVKKFVPQKQAFDAFDMHDVTPLFAILCFGCMISIIMAFVECFSYRLSNRYQRKRKFQIYC